MDSPTLETRAEAMQKTLREWRIGTHTVYDEEGRETGEYVDQEKTFAQMQTERDEAAALLAECLQELKRRGKVVDRARYCIELLSFNFGGSPGPNGATNPQLQARDNLAAALKELESSS